MRVERRASIRRDIPYYRQHYDFTCGPASLMMAMKYLDASVRLGKDLEIDLWREGNLIAVLGTSRYGLAYSAAVRGFSVKVASNTDGIDFADMFIPALPDPDMQLLKDHFYERRTRCRKLGVRERQETITGSTIFNSFSSNHIPLIVTTSMFHGQEDLPHWVVVTGIDDKFMYLNDPSDTKRRRRKIERPDLAKFIGYHGAQSMVEVWRD
jgi:predicted double-glycine peptidase